MNIHVKDKNIKGHIIIDGQEVGQTTQCVHCSAHFMIVRGSGVKRGWCTGCNGVTCGTASCGVCAPYEARLDLADAISGRDTGEAKKLIARYAGITPII